jgi:Carboxypeptidase regulatory-like domain
MNARRIALVVMAMGLLLQPIAGWSQTAATGAIAGVAKDSSGAVLPGVTVEAASPALIEKVRTAVTDGQGLYRIVDLRPGTYTVTFTVPGFSTFKRDGIELETAFTATVNAEMKVGALEETVTVSGEAPIVDTQNVMSREVFTKKTVDALPVGLNTGMYATLIPAAKIPTTDNGATGGLDVGGTQSERSTAVFSVHGGTNDMKLSQDGLQFTRGAGGATTWSMNRMAAQEVNIQVGGITAESETGGIQLAVVPKEGGNRFSGTFALDGTAERFQSDNLDDELRARGVTGSPTVRRVYNLGGGFGGPILQDKVWFYTSHRKWDTSQWLPGKYYNATQGTPVFTPGDLASSSDFYRSHTLRTTWQASARHKINFTYEYQSNCNCIIRLIAQNRAAEATGDHFYSHQFPQVSWSFPATNRLLFEAGAAALLSPRHNDLIKGVTPEHIPVIDLATGFAYNARGDAVSASGGGRGTAHEAQANERFAVSYVTGTHNFKTGFFHMRIKNDQLWDLNQALTYRFRNGVPNSLIQWVAPTGTNDRAQNLGLYVQDQWTMSRLTLNLGVRYDQYWAWVPDTDIPAGRFVGARHYDETNSLLSFKDINPRVGAAYDLFGNGRTAVKGFVGRYVIGRGAGTGNANPAAAIVLSATRTWTDTNGNFAPDCNLANLGLDGECGAVNNANFGNPAARNITVDRDVTFGFGNRDYTWQGSVSVGHELRPGVGVDVGYFRTWYGNQAYQDNELVTPADFDQYCITAPVDARLPGGGGNQICELYDIKASKFGQVQNLQSLAGGRRSRVFDGVDINLNARFGRGGMLAGGVALGNTVVDDCGAAVDNPAQGQIPVGSTTPVTPLRFCRTTLGWTEDVQFKVYGAYPLPWDLQASANLQMTPGPMIAADYVVTNAELARALGRPTSTATATVALIEPNTMFENRATLLDLRFSRRFRMGRTTATGNFDMYNAFNANSLQGVNGTYGPTWLNGLNVLSGRLLRFGVQLEF